MKNKITAEDAAAVFEKAAKGHSRRTNQGLQITVDHGGYLYRVIVSDRRRAFVEDREGFGGCEYLEDVNATAAQDRALRIAHFPHLAHLR